MQLQDLIVRYYTKELVDLRKKNKEATVFDMFDWKKVDVVMTNYTTGEKIVEMLGLDFPVHFSQNACDIIASKYLRRSGVNTPEGKETSYKQLVDRMVKFWVASALDEKLITKEESIILYDELAYMMVSQMWAPNSPQWFNTGLEIAYGIKGEKQGHFYFDEEQDKVVESKDSYTRTQGSACFIVGVNDSLLGPKSITHQLETETRLFKFGSGVGTNWSNIRGEGEPLSGGGKSSGLMSFLNVFNANAGAIKSGGTTRRAAKMLVLDIDHPDIEQFICWKALEEQKVRDLGKMGYNTHFDGDAYATVGGQNGNNSVRVSNLFMDRVSLDGATLDLNRRVDGKLHKTVEVAKLWDDIAKAAWECGDPGLQYDDTFNEWHTCPAGEDGKIGEKHNRINATNPCFAYNTRILTADGYKLIGELKDQEVMLVNKDGEVKAGKVWLSGVKDTVKLTLSNGKTIECTPDHVFMTIDGREVQAKDLIANTLMPNTLAENFTQPKVIGYLVSKSHNGKVCLPSEDSLTKYALAEDIISETGNQVNWLTEYDINECIFKRGNKFRKDYSYTGEYLLGQLESYIITHKIGEYTELDLKYNEEIAYDLSNLDIKALKNSNNKLIVDTKDLCNHFAHAGLVNRNNLEAFNEFLKKDAPTVIKVEEATNQEVFDFRVHKVENGEEHKPWGVVEGVVVHNCSEYAFLDDTACNLASINLMAFYDGEKFDIKGYKHCVSLCQLVLEATIHWGQFPTEEIARKSYMFRTTGLGYANLGALLMHMALGYDTEEARQVSAGLLSLLTGQSYVTSALMAERVGAFRYYNLNKEHMKKVIRNHGYISTGLGDKVEGLSYKPYTIDKNILDKTELEGLYSEIRDAWLNAEKLGNAHGFRNAQVSVLAPTGTISFAMDCTTTSSEPFFANMVYKKLVGGSGMMLVNDCIEPALKKLGYKKDEIAEIVEYVESNFGLIEAAPHLKDEHLVVFDTASKATGGVRFIEPMGHVRMMAALTPYVSGAISKTVNMPNDATVEDIKEIYYKSWQMGVKAIALYRDGCKVCQPLNVAGADETKKVEDMTYAELLEQIKQVKETDSDNLARANELQEELAKAHARIKELEASEKLNRVKPEGIRTANVHEAEMGGIKLYITVSRYPDGNISEVYISAGRQGSLVKGLLDSISTTISEMIQYGVSAKDIATMYRGQKFEPSGFVGGHPYIKMADSISDLISKVIDIELGDYTFCQIKPQPKSVEPMKGGHTIDTTIHARKTKENDEFDVITDILRNEPNSENSSRKMTIENVEIVPKKEKGVGTRVYGEKCLNCGSDHLLKNGTCKVCQDCGTTTGCS